MDAQVNYSPSDKTLESQPSEEQGNENKNSPNPKSLAGVFSPVKGGKV